MVLVLCNRIYRAPSLASACALAARNGHETTPDAVMADIEPASSCQDGAVTCPKGIDVHNAVYLLNPSGDLTTTQATFEDLFKQQSGWQVRFLLAVSDVLPMLVWGRSS